MDENLSKLMLAVLDSEEKLDESAIIELTQLTGYQKYFNQLNTISDYMGIIESREVLNIYLNLLDNVRLYDMINTIGPSALYEKELFENYIKVFRESDYKLWIKTMNVSVQRIITIKGDLDIVSEYENDYSYGSDKVSIINMRNFTKELILLMKDYYDNNDTLKLPDILSYIEYDEEGEVSSTTTYLSLFASIDVIISADTFNIAEMEDLRSHMGMIHEILDNVMRDIQYELDQRILTNKRYLDDINSGFAILRLGDSLYSDFYIVKKIFTELVDVSVQNMDTFASILSVVNQLSTNLDESMIIHLEQLSHYDNILAKGKSIYTSYLGVVVFDMTYELSSELWSEDFTVWFDANKEILFPNDMILDENKNISFMFVFLMNKINSKDLLNYFFKKLMIHLNVNPINIEGVLVGKKMIDHNIIDQMFVSDYKFGYTISYIENSEVIDRLNISNNSYIIDIMKKINPLLIYKLEDYIINEDIFIRLFLNEFLQIPVIEKHRYIASMTSDMFQYMMIDDRSVFSNSNYMFEYYFVRFLEKLHGIDNRLFDTLGVDDLQIGTGSNFETLDWDAISKYKTIYATYISELLSIQNTLTVAGIYTLYKEDNYVDMDHIKNHSVYGKLLT